LTRQKIITTQSFAEEKVITQIDHAPIHGGPEISQPPVFIVCDPDKEVAVPSTYDTGDKIKLINSCAHE
jgi:hypothetical protein